MSNGIEAMIDRMQQRIDTLTAERNAAAATVAEYEKTAVMVNIWGMKLLESLGDFLHAAAAAGRPVSTKISIRVTDAGEPVDIIHLWATTDGQEPAARCRVLAAERDTANERAHDLARLLDQARHAAELDRARIAELELNDQEIDSLFELRWQADHRAIERWRAATGREFVRPDHADLCVWLMDRIVELERSLEKSQTVIALEREARQMTQDRLNERIAELEAEAQLFRHVAGVAAGTADRIAAAEARIAEIEPLAEVGRRKLLEGHPDVERDWACAQCRPESDMLRDGFVCLWHRAIRAAGIGDAL